MPWRPQVNVRGLSLNCKDKKTAVVIQAAGRPLHLQPRPVLAELKSIYCLPQGAPPPLRLCSSSLRLHAGTQLKQWQLEVIGVEIRYTACALYSPAAVLTGMVTAEASRKLRKGTDVITCDGKTTNSWQDATTEVTSGRPCCCNVCIVAGLGAGGAGLSGHSAAHGHGGGAVF